MTEQILVCKEAREGGLFVPDLVFSKKLYRASSVISLFDLEEKVVYRLPDTLPFGYIALEHCGFRLGDLVYVSHAERCSIDNLTWIASSAYLHRRYADMSTHIVSFYKVDYAKALEELFLENVNPTMWPLPV